MTDSKYPEFNSDVLTPGTSRRIRLYQVAAIIGTRRYYDTVTNEGIAVWIKSYKVEASHLCRYVSFGDRVVNPDGSYSSPPIVARTRAASTLTTYCWSLPSTTRAELLALAELAAGTLPFALLLLSPLLFECLCKNPSNTPCSMHGV